MTERLDGTTAAVDESIHKECVKPKLVQLSRKLSGLTVHPALQLRQSSVQLCPKLFQFFAQLLQVPAGVGRKEYRWICLWISWHRS